MFVLTSEQWSVRVLPVSRVRLNPNQVLDPKLRCFLLFYMYIDQHDWHLHGVSNKEQIGDTDHKTSRRADWRKHCSNYEPCALKIPTSNHFALIGNKRVLFSSKNGTTVRAYTIETFFIFFVLLPCSIVVVADPFAITKRVKIRWEMKCTLTVLPVKELSEHAPNLKE